MPYKVEEGKNTENEKKEAGCDGCGELLSRVLELENELKTSERKRFELINENMALQIKRRASQEEESGTHQELVSLKERMLTKYMLKSQVRRLACRLEALEVPTNWIVVISTLSTL